MVVAQLVEPQIVILVVAGSSPVDHPIFLAETAFTLLLFIQREATKLTPTPFLNTAIILRHFRFQNHSSANCYDTDYLRVSLTCSR